MYQIKDNCMENQTIIVTTSFPVIHSEKSNMATTSPVKNDFFVVYMSIRSNFTEKCYGRKNKKILYMLKKNYL